MNSTSDWKIQNGRKNGTSSASMTSSQQSVTSQHGGQGGGATASPIGWTVTPAVVPTAIVKNVHNSLNAGSQKISDSQVS